MADPTTETAARSAERDPIATPLRFSYYKANGIKLHVAEAGPADGPAIILLHGFPEFWYGWRHQIDALAAAGYRLLAPDQRGYNLSDKPRGIAAYDLDNLAQDVVGLADAAGLETFRLIGHDWGASVAWWLASRHPDRLDRFVAIAAAHPLVWLDAMRNDPVQRKVSGYVKAFRLPWLPELLIRSGNFTALASALADSARPEACSAADLAKYRAAWSQPGAITAMLNYYRALLAQRPEAGEPARIEAPCLVLWGVKDKFGIQALAERSAALCDHADVVYLDASHWVPHDLPQRVNALLLDFLAHSNPA